MRHKRLLQAVILSFLFGLIPRVSCAANGGVIAGGDVQAAINAASNGDTIYMEPGEYNQDIVLNKSISIVSTSSSEKIRFLKSVTISSGTNSFQQCFFGGEVDSAGATVSIVDALLNAPITVAGGKLTMKRVILSANAPLTLTNSASFEGLRVDAAGAVASYGQSGALGQFLSVQTTYRRALSLNFCKVWMGYSLVLENCSFNIVDSDAVLIGNNINHYVPGYSTGIGRSKIKLVNNLFVNGIGNGSSFGLYFDGVSGEVINNTIYTQATPISVYNLTAPLILRGNIFRWGGGSPGADVQSRPLIFISYCSFSADLQSMSIAPLEHCLIGQDPQLSNDYSSLLPTSPCIHAGMPGAIYNNRLSDAAGSQNTIGRTGGPQWNPANYMNDNPMVFLMMGPQSILKGAQTTIPITAAASAGH